MNMAKLLKWKSSEAGKQFLANLGALVNRALDRANAGTCQNDECIALRKDVTNIYQNVDQLNEKFELGL